MSALDPNTLVTALLGVGGATFLGAAAKAINSVRSGAKAKDRDTVGGLREQRDEAEERARIAVADRDYHLRQNGRLGHQLTRAGIEPITNPEGVLPPSLREPVPAPAPTRRRRKAPSAE